MARVQNADIARNLPDKRRSPAIVLVTPRARPRPSPAPATSTRASGGTYDGTPPPPPEAADLRPVRGRLIPPVREARTVSTPRQPTITGPDEGELIDVAGDRYRYLADHRTTDGRYGLWEATVPPGCGPPPHVHRREDEGFYVIEGHITLTIDGTRLVAGPGSFVNMPSGTAHSFRNESNTPARMLILVAPGGMEEMFRRAGSPVADANAPIPPLDADGVQRLRDAAPEFDIEILPPS